MMSYRLHHLWKFECCPAKLLDQPLALRCKRCRKLPPLFAYKETNIGRSTWISLSLEEVGGWTIRLEISLDESIHDYCLQRSFHRHLMTSKTSLLLRYFSCHTFDGHDMMHRSSMSLFHRGVWQVRCDVITYDTARRVPSPPIRLRD